MGITVPIIPGIKPINLLNQLTVLPKIFHIDLPQDLVKELKRCRDNADARLVGTEWAIRRRILLPIKYRVFICIPTVFPVIHERLWRRPFRDFVGAGGFLRCCERFKGETFRERAGCLLGRRAASLMEDCIVGKLWKNID